MYGGEAYEVDRLDRRQGMNDRGVAVDKMVGSCVWYCGLPTPPIPVLYRTVHAPPVSRFQSDIRVTHQTHRQPRPMEKFHLGIFRVYVM